MKRRTASFVTAAQRLRWTAHRYHQRVGHRVVERARGGRVGSVVSALFALGTHQFAYAARGIGGLPDASDRSNVRQSTYFSAWLDYNANTWFTAEVATTCFVTSCRETAGMAIHFSTVTRTRGFTSASI